MKKILQKHMNQDLPPELRAQKRYTLPFLSSLAVLLVILITLQVQIKKRENLALVADEQWWVEFDQEIDQEVALVLADLEEI